MSRRRLALVVLAVGCGGWPTGAEAGTLGPTRPLAIGTAFDGARCLRTTGSLGHVLLQAPRRRGFATDVLDLAGSRQATLRLGTQTACAEGTGTPAGTAVVAPVVRGSELELRARSGPGAAVQTLTRGALSRLSVSDLAVAATLEGRLAIAWVETLGAENSRGEDVRRSVRIRLAQGRLGAPLGTARTIATERASGRNVELGTSSVALGFDGAGTLTVLTALAQAPRGKAGARIEELFRLEARTVSAPGVVSRPVILDETRQGPLSPVLSVAPGGTTLAAAAGTPGVTGWLRAPGATRFDRRIDVVHTFDGDPPPVAAPGVRLLADTAEPSAPGVIAGANGSGVLAWRTDESGLAAVTFAPGGRVGETQVLLRRASDGSSGGYFFFFSPDQPAAPIPEEPEPAPSLALASDGRLALAATRAQRRGPNEAYAAFGSLADGFGPARRVSNAARSATGGVALLDAGGDPTVAFSDENGDLVDTTERISGRLNLIRTSAGAGAQPAPTVRLLRRPGLTVRGGRSFTVRARCPSACDVRFALDDGVRDLVAGTSRRDAGPISVTLGGLDNVVGRRGRKTPLTVTAGAPGSTASRTTRTRLAIRRLPLLPAPRVRVESVRRTARTATIALIASRSLRAFQPTATPEGEAGFATRRVRRVAPLRYRVRVSVTRATRRVRVTGYSDDDGEAALDVSVRLPPAPR